MTMQDKPISSEVFQKMLFCDKIFHFLELEESLYFTAVDVEFHSKKVNEQDLLDINYKHAC